MNEPYHRYNLFPAYKANRRGGHVVHKRGPRVVRRPVAAPNPELRFIFALPPDLGFAVAPGPTGITGVSVTIAGVEVRGHGRDWLFAQAAAYLRSIWIRGRGKVPDITGVLICPSLPGTTISGPMRPGYEQTYTIEIVSGDPVVIISRTALRPLVFAGRG